ncbi:acyl-CoA dehydrogenase [Intestinibacillus massiliensis]|uniref:acyl-CoA dehydrogenase n=1 Tax=Intestinibacillus massiliensis TaxID=1871029 RepID=UPI000B35BFDF|nr:acyl-CoA dehydrogenase [Intestinibacillus massiliensis]MCB6365996.1 acyl-CoA dehydrogenase [Intestinibacillus massiliensis]
MDFRLTKQQAMVQKLCREFAINEVEPIAAEIDEQERYPEETVQKLMKYGLMGIQFPKEVGGSGGDYICYSIAIEEASRFCGTTGCIISSHATLGAWPIYAYGTPEQKEKFLRPLVSGQKLGAFGLTEPNAGTDSACQQTTAERQADGTWLINGSKVFITGGGRADTYVIFAMTNKAAGNKGISAFIVDKNDPGFKIGKIEHKMGIRGSQTSELIFEDMVLPADRLLGQENKGFKIAMQTLDGGRIGIASQALGIAQGALDKAVQYMQERVQFGRTLDKFQGLQWMVADMEVKIDAARLLIRRAAFNHDVGLPFTKEAAMAKLYASEVAMEVTTKCVQLHGGYGYIREYPMERMMRDAKITEIYEGTSQVQRMVIAGQIFKKK